MLRITRAEMAEIIRSPDKALGALLGLVPVLAHLDPVIELVLASIDSDAFSLPLADLNTAKRRVIKRVLRHHDQIFSRNVWQLHGAFLPQFV